MTTPLHIVVAFPLITQAQADEGNALALSYRLRVRDRASNVTYDHAGTRIADADIVLIGGLDETGVPELTQRLRESDVAAAAARGAVIIGINAGYLALGRSFQTADDATHEGLGLLDVTFTWGASEARPIVAECTIAGVPTLSGYESRNSMATLGPTATPLSHIGGAADQPEGVIADTVMGTFIHGPLLARNPALADHVLELALGESLADVPAGWAEHVRAQRVAEDAADPSGWAGFHYGQHNAIVDNPALRRAN